MKYDVDFLNLFDYKKIGNSVFNIGDTSTTLGNHKKFEINESNDSYINTKGRGEIIVKSHIATHEIYEGINANEHFFTYLANKCGIKTTEQCLVSVSEDDSEFLLFCKRFDNEAKLIHVTDFLGLKHYTDFRLNDLTQKLNTQNNSFELKMDIGKQIFYNLLIRNLDTHANNFSVMYKDGAYNISPMYDISHTESLLTSRNVFNTKFLIEVNDKNKNITIRDLLYDLDLSANEEKEVIDSFEKIINGVKNSLHEIHNSFVHKEQIRLTLESITKHISSYSNEMSDVKFQKAVAEKVGSMTGIELTMLHMENFGQRHSNSPKLKKETKISKENAHKELQEIIEKQKALEMEGKNVDIETLERKAELKAIIFPQAKLAEQKTQVDEPDEYSAPAPK